MATGTGCVVEIDVGGALNTQFWPAMTSHYQEEVFYDDITCDNILFNAGATYDIGASATPARDVSIGRYLNFPDYDAPLIIGNATTYTTHGAIIGHISVSLDGTGGRIPIYANS